MPPSASPRPPAAIISLHYDDDVPGATEALLTLLRHPISKDASPDEERGVVTREEEPARANEATAA
jgi:hypothetical protein